jgi:outer membrane immunogenic protein
MASPGVAGDVASPANWNGLFVGVHAGGDWQDSNARFDNGGDDSQVSLSLDGAIVGIHGGYRAQWGNVVLGIAGDFTALPGADETFRNDEGLASFDDVTLDPERLWSVRGELGYAFGKVLVFGTAGVGSARYEVRSVTPADPASGSVNADEKGFVYGGGAEWKIHDNVSIGFTYLHYDVGTSFSLGDLPDGDPGDFARFDDIDVVRANLTLQLNGS